MADGHLTKLGRLSIALSNRDVSVLESLNRFLGNPANIRVSEKFCYFAVNDIDTVDKLKLLFDIKDRKTYNPPTYFNLTGDRRDAFLIGYIDGDGSIQFQTGRNDCRISIKAHSSWKEYLSQMMGVSFRINSQGYSYGCIAENKELKRLKRFTIDKNLPVLSRKWDKIDLDYTNRSEIANSVHRVVELLYDDEVPIRCISDLLDINYTTVYMALKRKGKL